jgi:folate-binding protein YgfZ
MDAKSQVEAAHSRALALNERDRVTLVVTGKDRISWLNGLFTCDLVKRAADAAVYGLAVARSGKVLCDATVIVDEAGERVLVSVPRGVVDALRTHLDHYLVMEDAEMSPELDAFEAWSLHGPRSADALAAARAAGAVGGVVDRTGLGGAFALAPVAVAGAVRAALESAATVGDEEGGEALRLERAIPRFGADFDERTYPQEAGLEKVAVSFDKGCYLGQEVVCMLEMRGHVKRKLAALVVDEPAETALPERGARVSDDQGGDVGEVTSAGRSPTLGKTVALAMLKRAAGEPGRELRIGSAHARVVERPA